MAKPNKFITAVAITIAVSTIVEQKNSDKNGCSCEKSEKEVLKDNHSSKTKHQ